MDKRYKVKYCYKFSTDDWTLYADRMTKEFSSKEDAVEFAHKYNFKSLPDWAKPTISIEESREVTSIQWDTVGWFGIGGEQDSSGEGL